MRKLITLFILVAALFVFPNKAAEAQTGYYYVDGYRVRNLTPAQAIIVFGISGVVAGPPASQSQCVPNQAVKPPNQAVRPSFAKSPTQTARRPVARPTMKSQPVQTVRQQPQYVPPPQPIPVKPQAVAAPVAKPKAVEQAKIQAPAKPPETRVASVPKSNSPAKPATPTYKPAETRPVPVPAGSGGGEVICYVELYAGDKDTLLKFQGSGKEILIRKGERKYAVARASKVNGQYQPIGLPELLDYIPPGAVPIQSLKNGG